MTAVRVCSLILNEPQTVPPGGYFIVRFPYAGESYDAWGMHEPVGGDWKTDSRSGLIYPAMNGWGTLTANIHWEDGNYSELRDRFVRDPIGEAPDSTATDHRSPSPGMQCFTKQHQLVVHPDVPLAFLASHNDSAPRRITHAQFKLSISPVEEP
ncbi:MAG: hypothetical protein HOY76_02640 [Streptomyces sp.]|nr:hypothetical protein [Streptomyces sp.]